jgi:hypothetical protein
MRHPYTTNAKRLSSAQTMLDRATDDRTDFSDWYGSDHYAIWKSDTIASLLDGKACWGFERGARVEMVQWLDHQPWDGLTDAQKEVVNSFNEYVTAHLEYRLTGGADEKALSEILYAAMMEDWRKMAADMADEKARDYYDSEVAK